MLKNLTLKLRLLLVVILSGAFFITLGLIYIAQVRTSLTQEVVVERGAVLQSVLEERLKAKEEFGIGFAVMLSERAEVIWSLKSGRRDTLTEPLERILTRFRETTNYRGLRVQFHTDEGVSWLRSWNHEHHGDDVRFRPSIQRMLSEKTPFASSDEMGRAGFAIRALAPIFDRGEYIGSLEVLQGVGSISRDFEAEGRFYLLLLNQNMVEISPPLASNTAIGRYVVANNNWFNDRTLNIAREMDLTELSETGYYYSGGTRYFATATPLVGDDGQVLGMHIVGEPIELLNANIQQATSTAWAFMGLLVLLVIGMGITITWVIQSSVVRPIAKSVSFLAKKQNDLTARLKVGGQDELGSLFNAFNQHTETLAKVLGEVSQTADHLGESAEQLLGASDHSSHLAVGQQKETDQVASASAQMAASSTEMADHAAATLSAAEEAQQQTDQGSAIVTTTITAIESLADRMKQMIPVIERLNQGSQDIGQVIDTISEVAEQTNLLALNAAIEAARAGEHGRGFAVVADEVRMLASRTQDATGEIHRIIQEVRSASKDVSNAIEVGTKDAFECAEQAQKAGSALELIKEAVSVVNERGAQISNAASEQSQVANEVSESMVRIHELAEQNTQAAEETRRVNQMLAERSNKLKALVDKFKI